jgi:hypothetical protein
MHGEVGGRGHSILMGWLHACHQVTARALTEHEERALANYKLQHGEGATIMDVENSHCLSHATAPPCELALTLYNTSMGMCWDGCVVEVEGCMRKCASVN